MALSGYMSTSFGRVSTMGPRPWRGYTNEKPKEAVSGRGSEYRSPGDNSSPAGRMIPAFMGTGSYDGMIVWWSDFSLNREGQVRASFAAVFADCQFASSASLLKLFADKEVIVSRTGDTRKEASSIRFYDGTQTEPDPLLVRKLGEDEASAWTGLVYIVGEEFICTKYGDRLPLFRAVISGAATDNPGLEEESTLTFGSIDPSYSNNYFTVDRVKNHAYLFYWAGADDGYISVIDIATNAEISRSRITETNYTLFEYMVALDGTDYFVCTGHATSGNQWYELMLVNAYTGEVVTRSYPITIINSSGQESPFEAIPHTAVLMENGASTKFMLITGLIFAPLLVSGASLSGAVIVDVTDHTFTWVAHHLMNPLPGNDVSHSVAIGAVQNGVVEVFYHSGQSGVVTIRRALISASGFTTSVVYTTNYTFIQYWGLAYDPTDNMLWFYESNGFTGAILRQINVSTGDVESTVSTGLPQGLLINYGNSSYGSKTNTKPKAGYAIALHLDSAGNVYSFELSTGTFSLLLDKDDFSDEGIFGYFDQIEGVYMEETTSSSIGTEAGFMNKISLGDVTPNLVDLTDIFTQIALATGKFVLGDLEFTGFPGGEVSGAKIIDDTSLEDVELSIASLFDVKIVPSDGKRKYIFPPRDGSFAIDIELDESDFVEIGTLTALKTINAGEDELAGVTVGYYDQDADYQKFEQSYDRPIGVFDVTPSRKHRTVPSVLSMTAAQALQAAMILTFRSVYGNKTEAFTLVPSKGHVEPGDIVSFNFRGFSTVARIREAVYNPDFTQTILAYEYLQFSEATYEAATVTPTPAPSLPMFVRLIHLDIPLIEHVHDLNGTGLVHYDVIVAQGEATMDVAALYRSTDGSTFSLLGSLNNTAPIAGVITAIYGTPADPFEVDETSTLEILISSGDPDRLVTISETAFQNGSNLAAIGTNGRWVLLYFRTVSVSGNNVVLSGLLWGVHGSEPYIEDLVVGDTFVFLKAGEYFQTKVDDSEFGDTFYYKASSGASLGQVMTHAYVANGAAEKPYACVNLAAEYYSGGIKFVWDYRSRVADGTNPDDTGEETLAFEVEIMDGSDVKRLITGLTAAEAFWTDAEIVADFGSLPASWVWRVYQISVDVGRGHMAEQTSTVSSGVILLAGDEQSGTDRVLLAGDEQSGTDVEAFTEIING